MEEMSASPLIVPLLFLIRCLLPVAVLILISYLLRKGGWIGGLNNNHDPDTEDHAARGGNAHV